MSGRASGYVKGLIFCPNGEPLSRNEKLVALVLADSHQDRGRGTFPSVRTMAEDALMDERACRRVLAALERKGVIVRRRGEHQGRGQMTFYFFPALDAKGGAEALLPAEKKEDTGTPLFSGKRRAEGGQKGDKTAPPSYGVTGTGTKASTTPPAPSRSEGDVSSGPEHALERATDQVCSALGIAENQRRKRRMIASAVKRACEKGEPAPTVALGMIAAVHEQDKLHLQRRLKFKFGLQRFLAEGIWRDYNRWGWDPAEMRLQAEASMGSR